MDLPFALEGFFFEKVNGSLSLSTILYMRQPHAIQLQKAPFALLLLLQSLISAPFAALHLNGVCTWTSQLPLRGSFSKRSTGRRVNGSNRSTGQMGRRVTFTFTILYMIADDARLTPPRCKKHTAYDNTRLTPQHCKNHTASFARPTSKFPSDPNLGNLDNNKEIWPESGLVVIITHKTVIREEQICLKYIFQLGQELELPILIFILYKGHK